MALPWQQVESNPDYQNLPFDEQQKAKDQYFSSVVAPQVPQDQVDVAKHQFYLDTNTNFMQNPTWHNLASHPVEALGSIGQQAREDPTQLFPLKQIKNAGESAFNLGENLAENTAKEGPIEGGIDTLKPVAKGALNTLGKMGAMASGKEPIITKNVPETLSNVGLMASPLAGVGAADETLDKAFPNRGASTGIKTPGGGIAHENDTLADAASGKLPPEEEQMSNMFGNTQSQIPEAKQKAYAIANIIAKNEGIDLEQAAKKAMVNKQSGLPLTNLDALTMGDDGFPSEGYGFQASVRSALQQPNEGVSMARGIAKRQTNLNGYMDNLLDKYFSEGNVYHTMDEANQGMNEARPLYEQAMSKAPVYNDEINRFLQDHDIKAGIPAGIRLQRLEALARGEKPQPFDTAITNFDESGAPVYGQVPNMRLIDAAKRGIDAKIEAAQANRQFQGRPTSEERALAQVKTSFLKAVDAANPDYAAARQAYATPASVAHASEMGRSFKNMDTEEIQNFFNDPETTEAQKAAFKDGARYELKDDLAKVRDGTPAVSSFWKTNMRDKLQAMMQDDNAFQGLTQGMEHIRNMASNNQVLKGSQTFSNFAYDKMLGEKPTHTKLLTAIRYATRPHVAAARDAAEFVKDFYDNKASALDQATRAEYLKALLSDNPEELNAAALWGKQNMGDK
jgi:hypothetical protein